MAYDTDKWPFVQARDYLKWKGPPARRPVDGIVIHVMQAKETALTAENLGEYFQHPDYPSSTHIGCDSNSVVQYVKDNDIAYGAKGYNQKGIHVELAGFTSQNRAQWLDPFGIGLMAVAGDAVAQYVLKYTIPLKRLSVAELRAGKRGIFGHDTVSLAFKQGDHMDPGPDFPWDYFMDQVAVAYARRSSPALA